MFVCNLGRSSILVLCLSASAAASDFRVGVLLWSTNIPGQVAMRDGLVAEAKRINQEARSATSRGLVLEERVAGDGEAGIQNQIRQMKEMVDSQPDLIIVQPADNAALAGPLRAANQKGIPVVAYDQYIAGGVLAAYRTSDNHQAGYLDGEYIASKFPDPYEIRLILVEYPHVSSTVERVNGFLEALSALQQRVRILKTYSAVQPDEGVRAVAGILKDFPATNSVDVVFTVNDGGGLAVVDGLARAGRTEIMVASVDGDPASVENIRAGRLTVVDSAQFCGPLGAEAMKAAYAVLVGSEFSKHALVAVFPITKETLKHYPGWGGPVPADFPKPWPSKSPIWRGELKEPSRAAVKPSAGSKGP